MTDYLEAAERCATKNEFNRLHIDLEVKLTPLEMADLMDRAIAERFPINSVKWLRTSRAAYPDVFSEPEGYQREQLASRVLRFENSAVPRADKQVLLAFTGAANRMGLPIAPFLQCLPASQWSVILVNKERGRSFQHGWKEGPGSFPEVNDLVSKLAEIDDYAGVATVGSSSGGLPAILSACLLGAGAGLALSGRFTEASRSNVMSILEGRKGNPRLTFAYGADHGTDVDDARLMRAVLGNGEMVPVEDCDRHNVAACLQESGQLKQFLREALRTERIGAHPSVSLEHAP